jgi:hypothetical protein
MTITDVALAGNQGMHSSSRPEYTYKVTATMDSAYVDGGYPDFFATTLCGDIPALVGKTVVDIRQAGPCGGYQAWYDAENDAMQFWQYPTSEGPATQLADESSDLDGVVCLFVVKAI